MNMWNKFRDAVIDPVVEEAINPLVQGTGSLLSAITEPVAAAITGEGRKSVNEVLTGPTPTEAPKDPYNTQLMDALAKYGEMGSLYDSPFQIAATPDMAMPTAFSNPLEYSSFRQGQQDLVSMLQDRAAGKGPSVAEEMLKAQNDRAINQQMALAASQSGRGMPATQRQLMQQAAMGAQELGRQSAIARLQEQLAATGQLGNVLNQSRAGDQGFQNLLLRQGQGQFDVNAANMNKNLQQAVANLNQENIAREGQAAALQQAGNLMAQTGANELGFDYDTQLAEQQFGYDKTLAEMDADEKKRADREALKRSIISGGMTSI